VKTFKPHCAPLKTGEFAPDLSETKIIGIETVGGAYRPKKPKEFREEDREKGGHVARGPYTV